MAASRRVRLLTARVTSGGQTQEHGDVIDVPALEAQRLVDRGQALYETATAGPRESAALRTGPPKKE